MKAKLRAARPVDSEPGMPREEKVNALRHMVHCMGWQKVFKPAVQAVLLSTTDNVMCGTREKGEELLTDEALKQRALALNWILSWEERYNELAEQIEIVHQVAAATEHGESGPV